MAKTKPDNEILEFAINREQRAYNFYLALAQKVESHEIQKVLEEFAQEELEHKAKLEMELIKNGIVVDTTLKNNSFQISDYIISNEPTIDMDYKDLLELCIQKEDASFRIYTDLLPYTRDQNSKDVLLTIIEEEVKHKLRFEMEYENLLKNS